MKKISLINKGYHASVRTFRFFSGKYKNIKSLFFQIPYPNGDLSVLSAVKEYNKIRPYGPQKHICYVPMNNILFSKNGKVLSCSYNQKYILGTYPQDNIKSIIEGKNRSFLIAKHLNNDLACGCEYCMRFIVSKKYFGIKPMTFDKYSKGFNSSKPKVLEFDLSSRCNLNCIMCKEVDRETAPIDSPYNDDFIKELAPYFRHIKEAKFYGGEPFMIPQYLKIWQNIIEVNPKIKIFVITNGTILNDKIKNLLNSGLFDIGVSVDSLDPSTFEKIRMGASFSKVMEHIQWYSDYCKRKKTNLSLSMTIFRMNWREIPDMINFCNNLNCSIYFSYLYNPDHFSLWTLPSDKIDEIISYLSGFEFPKLTSNQIYNNNCYNDIIDHLKFWKNKNIEIAQHFKNKDYQAAWVFKLTDYLHKKRNTSLIDSEKESQLIKIKLEQMIIEAGYKDYLQHIYKELASMDIDSFFEIYNNISTEKVKQELEMWLNK